MTGTGEFQSMQDLAERVHFAHFMKGFNPAHPPVKFGRFEGIKAIGHGSFGIIFEVHDPELDRPVALKLCRVAGNKQRALLLREARILAKLRHHPNIITIHDVGRYESDDDYHGTPFIVLEFAEGGSGRTLIRTRPSWEDSVDIYRGAGRGLAAAHAEGIVHGDFKPSNVVIGAGGARLTDFGLARTLGSAGELNGGTTGYQSPEQILGAGNSPLADQFAFCVALWETIEGVRPFEAEDRVAMFHCILAQGFSVGARPSGMPPRLRMALFRGMAAEPDERWPSVDALVDELDAIRAPPIEPLRPRLPRGFLVYAVLGGLLGALIIAQLIDAPQEQVARSPSRAVEVQDTDDSDEPGLLSKAEANEAHERKEDESAEVGKSTTVCVVSADVFHVPSPELEEMCELIRSGKLEQAALKWVDVRGERSPETKDPQHTLKLMQLATETKIAADTCDDYALSVDGDVEKSAHALSDRLSGNYRYDKEKLGTSLQ